MDMVPLIPEIAGIYNDLEIQLCNKIMFKTPMYNITGPERPYTQWAEEVNIKNIKTINFWLAVIGVEY